MHKRTFPRCRWMVVLLCCLPAGLGHAQPVTQPFTFSLIAQPLPQVRQGAVVWGDYDNDGDLDAVVSGLSATGMTTGLYRNDGKRPAPGADSTVAFALVASDLQPLVYSRAAWSDFDRDGDLDLVLQGSRNVDFPYQPVTRLYRNDGGTLTEVADAGLTGLHSGAVAWGDYDNDGDPDLLVAGADADEARRTLLYRNDGGAFSPVETSLPGIAFGDAQWGDYDGDGDLDLALAGASEQGFVARIFRNNGSGSLTDLNADLDRVAFASLDWGDYDDDGDLDLLLNGGHVTPLIMEGVTHLYSNQGGTFARVDAGLAGVLAGTATWGDYDNDGDLDILVLGSEQVLGRRTARVYRNEAGDFVSTTLLVGVIFGAADWGDFEGDGDLDLLAAGFTSTGPSITNLYENRRQVKPPAPAAPALLRAEEEAGTVTLRWAPPVGGGLTYNLRVGTTPGGTDVLAPLADPETGRRRIARPGNAQQNTAWALRHLSNGTYYWSVQALNHAFAGSRFADEGTFTVTGATAVATEADPVLPTRFAVYPGYPNPFRAITTIPYDLPTPADVTLKVYNVLGQEVATLVRRTEEAGRHTVVWDGRDHSGAHLGAGLYLYRLRAGEATFTGKVTLLR